MLLTVIKATLGILLIVGGWLVVQAAWRRAFPGTPPGEDVLAGRLGCHQCPGDPRCDHPTCPSHATSPPLNNQSGT